MQKENLKAADGQKPVKRNGGVNRRRVMFSLLMAALGTLMFAMPAFAATIAANNVMANLISLMCSMFKYVGAAVFVWAIIQFVLATKRSDADSKADAVQTAVCGIALMSIAGIVNILGIGKAIDQEDNPGVGDSVLNGKTGATTTGTGG